VCGVDVLPLPCAIDSRWAKACYRHVPDGAGRERRRYDTTDPRVDDQLAVMVAARDEGLIARVGLSNVSLEQLRHAAAGTGIIGSPG
jgi:diketogulonate reductase-like aldo/keto reductase